MSTMSYPKSKLSEGELLYIQAKLLPNLSTYAERRNKNVCYCKCVDHFSIINKVGKKLSVNNIEVSRVRSAIVLKTFT